ncbi:MAG: O-antigen ligase family protein [Hyphomonadaceae bacterium]
MAGERNAGIDLGARASAGFFILFSPLANGGAMAFPPLLALCALIGAPWTRLWHAFRGQWLTVSLILAFAAWAAASAAWSATPDTMQGWRVLALAALGLLFCAGAGRSARDRALVRAAALAGAVTLIPQAGAEALFDLFFNRLAQPDAIDPGALMRNPGRGISALVVVFATGFGGWLAGSPLTRWTALIAAPFVGWLSLQFDMAVNALALGAAAGAFVLGWLAPQLTILAASFGLALWTLAAPFALPVLLSRFATVIDALPDSWAIRAVIWRFVSERIIERPLIGLGIDGSRSFDQRTTTHGVEHALVPLHPHNAALQIWLELGAIGALLAAAALIVGGLAAARAFRDNRLGGASVAALFVSAGLIANVSYGAWQEWWIAILFAAAALAAAARRSA